MRAPISVVIPTLNAQAQLGECLASLMPGVEAGLIRELIVSDGGSDDATVAVAKAWGAKVLTGAPSRGGQLMRGCDAAQGAWLMVLHADTRLQDGWVGPVITHLETHQAGWFRLAFVQGGLAGRVVSGWTYLRSRMGLPYGDQGLLLPHALYGDVGGYPDQPLMEDVALARALKGRLCAIDAVAETTLARDHAQGWLRRGARNFWALLRYFLGTSPDRLA
ncbi:glycosyltransferase [Roseobacter sp.]|uniref:glycosyltransferase n=1 Tax=Roseobacter sp. TaxID=1907202 RepID=UPI003298612D